MSEPSQFSEFMRRGIQEILKPIKEEAMNAEHEEALAEWVARRFRAAGWNVFAPHENPMDLMCWDVARELRVADIRFYDRYWASTHPLK
jgi:hypothetical protein